jgi:hypothetical protein
MVPRGRQSSHDALKHHCQRTGAGVEPTNTGPNPNLVVTIEPRLRGAIVHISCALSYSFTSCAHFHILGLPQKEATMHIICTFHFLLAEENSQRRTILVEVHSVNNLDYEIMSSLYYLALVKYERSYLEGSVGELSSNANMEITA